MAEGHGTMYSGEGAEPEAGKEVRRSADSQQFKQEPMPEGIRKGPQVTVLNATADPLGTLAAITALYEGRVVRDLRDVTHEERRSAFDNMTKTTLNSALECIQFTLLFEGIDRAFTHQLVRGRNAQYVQESLRFAVPEDWAADIPLPPSLAGLKEDDPRVHLWMRTLNQIEDSYAALVHGGVAAEEARGLLPHAILTRIHWNVSLRELMHVAGGRMCTQAQFIWRQVFAQVANALREYGRKQPRWELPMLNPEYEGQTAGVSDDWQFELIAGKVFRPVCFQTGKCAYLADFDRYCNIRERVEAFGSVGVPSSDWDKNYDPENAYTDGPPMSGQIGGPDYIRAIKPEEWLINPGAARLTTKEN